MTSENTPVTPALPPAATETQSPTPTDQTSNVKTQIGIIIGIVVVLGLLITGIVLLATAEQSTTTRVRDIFIIFMALESLVIGVALIILIIQLAALTNLIQNEIRPILKNTTETINNLKGTTTFITEQMVEPVIKLNEYLAGLKKLFDLLHLGK
jgi:nitrate reductase gamma subunit